MLLVELPASQSEILYCSRICAEDDGADLGMARTITREEYDKERWGEFCPMCETRYPAACALPVEVGEPSQGEKA